MLVYLRPGPSRAVVCAATAITRNRNAGIVIVFISQLCKQGVYLSAARSVKVTWGRTWERRHPCLLLSVCEILRLAQCYARQARMPALPGAAPGVCEPVGLC